MTENKYLKSRAFEEPKSEDSNATLSFGKNKLSLHGSLASLTAIFSILLVAVIAWMFLNYMEKKEEALHDSLSRIEQKHNEVSQLRIKACHDIQERGIDSLNENSAALRENAVVVSSVSEHIHDLEKIEDKNNTILSEILEVVRENQQNGE